MRSRNLFSTFIILSSLIQADLTTGLVANYTFNGDVLDVSGNDYHCTEFGDIVITATDRFGIENHAIDFDGANDWLDSNIPDSFNYITISLWVKLDTQNDNNAMIIGLGDDTRPGGLKLQWENIFLSLYSETEANGVGIQNIGFADGNWHHFVCTYDGSLIKVYLDVVSVLDEPTWEAYLTGNLDFSNSIYFGTDISHTEFVDFRLDDVRIYNRALSITEIADLYHENGWDGLLTYNEVPTEYTSIQLAIDSSVNGDTVLVYPGTYVENINFNGKNIVVGSLTLTTGDTSYISQTIIDGNSNGSVVMFESGENNNTELNGFTILNGSGSLAIDGSIGLNSIGGGGIHCGHQSSPRLKNLYIKNNVSTQIGGGCLIYDDSHPTFIDCIISDNYAPNFGAGVDCLTRSNPEFYNVIIKNNTCVGQGGGISLQYLCSPVFYNSIITGNTGEVGALLCEYDSNPVFVNSLITNNTATDIIDGPGGIRVAYGVSPYIVNTIIWNNTPIEYHFLDSDGYSRNSINISYSIISTDQNLIQIDDDGYFNHLSGVIDADPIFTSENDFHLVDTSPCIARGADSVQINSTWYYAPATDLDGNPRPRPVGTAPDIGAYENQTALPDTTYITGGTISTDSTWSLAQSPYVVSGDVLIGDARLIIEPGVKIIFMDGARFSNNSPNSSIRAIGTESDSILFINIGGEYQGNWQIDFQGGNANFKYCRFTDLQHEGLHLSDANSDSTLYVRNSYFDNSNYYHNTADTALYITFDNSSAPINQGREDAILQFSNLYGGMSSSGVQTNAILNAKYNYWGPIATTEMSAGPSLRNISTIYDYFDDNSLGTVDYSQFLDEPWPGGSPVFPDTTYINGGTITQDSTWSKARSPYVISGDVIVDNGATLTIEPGVDILFNPIDLNSGIGRNPYRSEIMFLDGSRLIAVGTETDSIVFRGNGYDSEIDYWAGISLGYYEHGAGNIDAFIKYCVIRDTDRGGADHAVGVMLFDIDTVIIAHNNFQNNNQSLYIADGNSPNLARHIVIENNEINNGQYGIGYSGYQLNITISKNSFKNLYTAITCSNGQYGNDIKWENNNFFSCNTQFGNPNFDVLAENNYWGLIATAEMNAGGNPKNISTIYDHFDDPSLALVNYSHWLDAPWPGGQPVGNTYSAELRITNNEFQDELLTYHSGDSIFFQVTDIDRNDDDLVPESITIDVWSELEDIHETVSLDETEIANGIFQGYIKIDDLMGVPVADGQLQVNHGDWMYFQYIDPADDWGNADTINSRFIFDATIHPGGAYFSEDLTFQESNSPYIVTGDVTFGQGSSSTLTIEPGTKIYFSEDQNDYGYISTPGIVWLSVQTGATLICNGTETDSIWLMPYDENIGWEGINIDYRHNENQSINTTISFTNIIGARKGVRRGGGGWEGLDTLYILNSRFSDCTQKSLSLECQNRTVVRNSRFEGLSSEGTIHFSGSRSDNLLSIKNCTFSAEQNGGMGIGFIHIDGNKGSAEIKYNTFTSDIQGSDPAIRFDGDIETIIYGNNFQYSQQSSIVRCLNHTSPVKATHNYWGTIGTPEMSSGSNPKNISVIDDYYDNPSYGIVNYSRWLDAPWPGGTPAPGGYTGELGLVYSDGTSAWGYSQGDTMFVQVYDPDLNLDINTPETAQVDVWSGFESTPEIVTLVETHPDSGLFRGSILIDYLSGIISSDGILQVSPTDFIYAEYSDDYDDWGLTDTIDASGLYNFNHFIDLADSLGINHGGTVGASWGDYNNDGWVDLAIDGNLFKNNSGSSFSDVSNTFSTGGSPSTESSNFGDYDNDGDLDIYYSSWGKNYFYRNDSILGFTEIHDDIFPTGAESDHSISWLDYNNDGFLDILFTNSDNGTLFKNRAGIDFIDVSSSAGLPTNGLDWAFAMGDIDNDYDQDIISRDGIYLKVSDTTYNYVGGHYGIHSISLGDYDNDGDLDIYGGYLYNNDNGTFTDVTQLSGLKTNFDVLGGNFGDFNNDGFLDIYVANRNGLNRLFINDGNSGFIDVTDAMGVAGEGGGHHSVAIADYDNDGDLDIAITAQRNIYNNRNVAGNWFETKLIGTVSNRDAIGARIRAVTGNLTQIREINGGSGYCAQNEFKVHFGLAQYDQVDTLTIYWPSGLVQKRFNLPANQLLTVIEANTPPVKINDLAVVDSSSLWLQLEWSAPIDDGFSGIAADYNLRMSTSPIDSANFSAATPVSGIPAPLSAGTLQSAQIENLSYNTTYYFAIKAQDDEGLWSPISNIATGTTEPQDQTAPGTVVDLAAGTIGKRQAVITWSAPADDGSSGRPVQGYSIHYSMSPINEGNFFSADSILVPAAALAPGATQTDTIIGLDPNSIYYTALKAYDEVPNWSAISNVVQFTTGSVPVIAGTPFPQNGYDAQRSRITPHLGATLGNFRWSYATGGAVSSSPVIDNLGNIYFGSEDGKVYSLDQAGDLIWSRNLGSGVFAAPAIGTDSHLFVACKNNKIYALNSASGDTIWTYSTGNQVFSSPVVSSFGYLYAGSLDNKLYALSSDTGDLLWTFTGSNRFYASPAITSDESQVIIGDQSGNLYAIDARSGSQDWVYNTGSAIYANAAVDSAGNIFVGAQNGKLYAVDNSGSYLWDYDTGGAIFYASPTIEYAGTVTRTSSSQRGPPTAIPIDKNPDSKLVRPGLIKSLFSSNSKPQPASDKSEFRLASNTPTYSKASVGRQNSTLPKSSFTNNESHVSHDPHAEPLTNNRSSNGATVIYIGSDAGNFHAVDAVMGTNLWTYPAGGQVRNGALLSSNGYVYFGSADDSVYCIKNDGSRRWAYKTGGDIYTSNAAMGLDGAIYIGAYDNSLYSVGEYLEVVDPVVVSTYPAVNSCTAPVDTTIEIKFNTILNMFTVDENTVYVSGNFRGGYTCTYDWRSTDSTLLIDPDSSFFHGEEVTILLTDAIKSVSGGIGKSYLYSLLIGTIAKADSLEHQPSWESLEENNYAAVEFGLIDSDELLDMIVVAMGGGWDGEYSAEVGVYFNQGGFYTQLPQYTFEQARGFAIPVYLDLVDYDQDGDFDMSYGGQNGGPVEIYQNNSGYFNSSPVKTFTVIDPFCSGLDWGIIDDNAYPDLVVNFNGNIYIYLNTDGNISETSSQTLSNAPGVNPALGDIDNDGDVDLLAGSVVWENTDGVFLNSISYDLNINNGCNAGYEDAALADYDQNGYLDVAFGLSNFHCDGIRVFDNDGTGYDNSVYWDANPAPSTHDIKWVDVDGDGDLDLASVGSEMSSATIYFNDSGQLNQYSGWTNGPLRSTNMAWGDIDNDGDLDLALVYSGDMPFDKIQIYINHLEWRFNAAYTMNQPEYSGTVPVAYTIENPSENPTSIICRYSIDNGINWLIPTTTSDTTNIASADYSGTLEWNSIADGLDHQELDVLFAITPYDAANTGRSDTVSFHLDNNTLPTISVTPIVVEQSEDINLSYSYADAENDTLTLSAEYQLIGDNLWTAATLAGSTSDLTSSSGTITWPTLTDLANQSGQYYLRLFTADNDLSIPDTLTISVDNYHNQSITLNILESPVRDTLAIVYDISDPTGDAINLVVRYSLNYNPPAPAGRGLPLFGTIDYRAPESDVRSRPTPIKSVKSGTLAGGTPTGSSLSGFVSSEPVPLTDNLRSATWLEPYIVGDTIQLAPNQYNDTLFWYTSLNLPGLDLDSVTLSINPSDIWQAGIGDTIIFELDNNYSPVLAITPLAGEQRDDITIDLNLIDAENDLSDLLCEYKQEFAAIWQTATLTGDTTDLAPGNHQLIWHSANDLPNYVGNALFRVRPNDADLGEYTSIMVSIDQVGAPEVALTLDVTTELSGDIAIDFAISDDEGDSVALEVYYSLDDGSSWNPASTTLTDPLDSLSYEGQLTWLSYNDTPGEDVNIARVKLVPFDGNYGPEQISAAFYLDNNLTPSLTLAESSDFWGGDVGITYNISDAENDSVDLICQYLDADDTWQIATILEQLLGIDQSNYSGTLTWVSASDLPALADTILFAVAPADTDPGEADTMVILLDNIPPAITVADISNEIYGDVTIHYSISNDGLTPVGLSCEYSFDSGDNWSPSTNISGALLNISTANYSDSLVWHSDQILAGQDLFNTRFRVTPFDSVNSLGTTTMTVARGGNIIGSRSSAIAKSEKIQDAIQPQTGGFTSAIQSDVNPSTDEVPDREVAIRYGTPDATADFHLDNNLVPTIQLTATGLWYSKAVPIPYAISDTESDDINYSAFYYYNDSWIATTAISPSSPITAASYNDQLSWNSLSDLPAFSGTLDFAVTVSDADVGFHDTIAVQIDRDNPISGIVSDGGFTDIDWSNDSTTIAAAWSGFSDELSGIATFEYSIGTNAGDSGVVDWQNNSLAETMSNTGLQLINGITYFVNVRCYDQAGNWVEVSSNGVTIDLFEPTIGDPVDGSLAEDLDWQIAIDSLHIYWTGNDTREMAYYEYCVGTTSADSNLVDWTDVGSDTYAHMGDLSLSEGTTYYASVRAYDLAGNRSLVATSDGINVDITPPIAGNLHDGLSDDLEYSESLMIIGLNWDSFSDDQSGILGYYYQLGSTPGGDEIKSATYTINIDSVTVTGLSLVHGQTYYASINAFDLVGHTSDLVISNGFTVDIYPGPPLITTVTPQHSVSDAGAWFDLTSVDSIVVEFSEPVRSWSMDLTSVVPAYNPMISYYLNPDSSRLILKLDNNLPSADSLQLSFADLTDFAGRNGGNYDYDFYSTILGDFNRDRIVDVNDISALLSGWSTEDFAFEMAPVTGTVPHLVSTPNQEYDLRDLMTFVRMWNWQHVDQTPVLARVDPSGLEPVISQQGNLLVLELPDNVQCGRFYLEYDQAQVTFDFNAVTTLEKIQLKQENKFTGQLLIECGVQATANDKAIVLNTASLSRNNPRFTLTYELFDDRAQLKGQGTIEKDLIAIPQEFALRQNYPNPFNPITTIEYDLPEDGNLKLTIYDILGREVIELANGYQEAGYKSIQWNGRNKSGQLVGTGMYFYAVEAGKYSAIRKMVLLK